jgi:hypothetical protein
MGAAEEYLIKLQMQGAEGLSKADRALLQLEATVRRETAALGALEGKLTSAKAKLAALQEGSGGKVSIDAVKRQQEAVRGIEAAIAAGKGGLDKLAAAKSQLGGLVDPEKLLGKRGAIKEVLGGELGNIASAASAAGGPLGAVSDKIQGLSAIAGKGGAAGVILVLAAALYTLARSAVDAAVGVVKFVLVAADAARSTRLLNDAAAGGVVAGAELSAVVADVAGKVPLARDEITKMGRALEVAHLSGRRMQTALEAMGITAAAVGPEAASKIEEIATRAQKFRRFWIGLFELEGTGLALADVAKAVSEQLKVTEATARTMILRGQLSVDQGLEAMAKAAQDKFGKTVAAQMLALDTQLKKLKENFGALFGGIDLEPVLKGLKMITSLFDQSTVSGQTLKIMIDGLFNPLLKDGATVFPVVRGFLQGLIIGVMVVEIGVLKLRKAFMEAFGGKTQGEIDWVKTAMYAGITVIGLMVGGALALAVALSLAAISAAMLLSPFIILAYGIYTVIQGIQKFKATMSGAGDALDPNSAVSRAANFVSSLVSTLSGGSGAVAAAAAGLGHAAASALKSALGIASPSRVAMEAAHNVTTTFAGQIEDGTSDTQAAFKGIVDPSAVGGGAKGGRGPKVGELHFHYHGGSPDDFEDFKAKARAWLPQELERLLGGGPEGATA